MTDRDSMLRTEVPEAIHFGPPKPRPGQEGVLTTEELAEQGLHEEYSQWCHDQGFWGIRAAWVYPAFHAIQVQYYCRSEHEWQAFMDGGDLPGIAPFFDYFVTTVRIEGEWPHWAISLAEFWEVL